MRKQVKGQFVNALDRPRRFIRLPIRKYSEKQIQDAARNARASLQIEGFTFSPEEEQFLLEKSQGKISQVEFVRKAKEFASNV